MLRRLCPKSITLSLLVVTSALLGQRTTLLGQQSISIVGNASISIGQSADFDLELTNTAPVEGYVIAVGYDPALLTVTAVSTTGSITEASGAELIVPELLLGGFTLGVVLDSFAPFDAQMIPIGTDQLLATFTAQAGVVPNLGDPDIITGFTFIDGALNNPPLDNIIVQGGQSIGSAEGLLLLSAPDGVIIGSPPPVELLIESGVIDAAEGCVRVLMTNFAGPTQGFVLAIAHDPAILFLEEINLDGSATDLLLPELVVPNLTTGGGTLGVVLDFQSPFLGQTIPQGSAVHLANFCYQCVDPPIAIEGSPPPPAVVTDLLFADGIFGSPPLENVVVVNGQSISPGLIGGTATCAPIVVLTEDSQFYCGPRDLPTNFDPNDPVIPPVEGSIGDVVEFCFFYSDPNDNVQGLQIAICHDCDLTFLSFTIEGSIFEEVGTEFVNFGIDNDPLDGDGCEFVAGLLLDALPPFDGQTVPPTVTPLLIGCAMVEIDAAATCGTDLSVEFCDNINGPNDVIIENIVIIDFLSVQGFTKNSCVISVVPEEIFQRGDCNSDDKVDLADAATIIGWQFQGVSILCPDACDANDDGFINLADSVLLTSYLFAEGPAPPDPGPIDGEDGPDPTPDGLEGCFSDDSVC